MTTDSKPDVLGFLKRLAEEHQAGMLQQPAVVSTPCTCLLCYEGRALIRALEMQALEPPDYIDPDERFLDQWGNTTTTLVKQYAAQHADAKGACSCDLCWATNNLLVNSALRDFVGDDCLWGN